METGKEYYICSKEVIDLLKPKDHSLGITMYPDSEIMKEDVFVAVLDFDEVQKVYNSLDNKSDFWVQEIVPGTMNVDKIKIKDFKKKCPWEVILDKIGLSNLNNKAMTISNLAYREGLNPIDFWNKIAR